MISIGCKKHPRFQAKSEREPKCRTCNDLWWLKRMTHWTGVDALTRGVVVYPVELKMTP